MDLQLDLRLDPGRLSAGADALETRAGDMRARRAEIDAAVDALLATWRGDTASRFTVLWDEWRAGADEVIAGLAETAGSLRYVRDELLTADADTADGHVRLRGRLG